jgi:N-acetylglutamate synthase
VNHGTIRTLEEVSMNALPALQQVMLDGWVLRFGGGYTGRANSVYPLYPGNAGVDGKIRACEELYKAKQIPLLFKMTAAAEPEGLDGLLEERGYVAFNHTSVQTLELTTTPAADQSDVECWDHPADAWLDVFFLLRDKAGTHLDTFRKLLAGIVVPARYVVVHDDGVPVACGMAVVQGEYVGLFDLTTHVHHRRQGLGTRLVELLLCWARAGGARTAYLQVMLANESAISLYAKLGFKEAYRYWYRRRR